jgi:hypothetical protein
MLSLLWLALPAFAQEEVTYEGSYLGDAPAYAKGKPVTISHSGGNLSVRCMETQGISARVQYTVRGTSRPAMEAFGNGVKMAVSGDANGGSVKTVTPSRGAGVTFTDVVLTVSLPKGTSALTITQTGTGWVEVFGCAGNLKLSSGTGGAFADGAYTSVNLTASGGSATVEQAKDVLWTGNSAISAPGGAITLTFASAQGGKFSAAGAEVSVQPLVMGTNTPTLVSGSMGVSGPTITLKAKDRVDVKTW